MLYFLLNEILEHECNFPCVQICHHKPALRVWAGAHGPDLLSDAVWPQCGPVPSEPVPLLPFLSFIQQEVLVCSLHPRHESAEPQQQSTWSPWQTEVSWPSFLSLTSTEWVCVRAFVHFCGFSTLCTERMLCVCARVFVLSVPCSVCEFASLCACGPCLDHTHNSDHLINASSPVHRNQDHACISLLHLYKHNQPVN